MRSKTFPGVRSDEDSSYSEIAGCRQTNAGKSSDQLPGEDQLDKSTVMCYRYVVLPGTKKITFCRYSFRTLPVAKREEIDASRDRTVPPERDVVKRMMHQKARYRAGCKMF